MEVLGAKNTHAVDTRVAEPPAPGQSTPPRQGLVGHERGPARPVPRQIEDAGGDGVLHEPPALVKGVVVQLVRGGVPPAVRPPF